MRSLTVATVARAISRTIMWCCFLLVLPISLGILSHAAWRLFVYGWAAMA